MIWRFLCGLQVVLKREITATSFFINIFYFKSIPAYDQRSWQDIATTGSTPTTYRGRYSLPGMASA